MPRACPTNHPAHDRNKRRRRTRFCRPGEKARACLTAPRIHLLWADLPTPRNRRRIRVRRERLGHNPRLVFKRPTAPALRAAQNLDPTRPSVGFIINVKHNSSAKPQTCKDQARSGKDRKKGRRAALTAYRSALLVRSGRGSPIGGAAQHQPAQPGVDRDSIRWPAPGGYPLDQAGSWAVQVAGHVAWRENSSSTTLVLTGHSMTGKPTLTNLITREVQDVSILVHSMIPSTRR